MLAEVVRRTESSAHAARKRVLDDRDALGADGQELLNGVATPGAAATMAAACDTDDDMEQRQSTKKLKSDHASSSAASHKSRPRSPEGPDVSSVKSQKAKKEEPVVDDSSDECHEPDGLSSGEVDEDKEEEQCGASPRGKEKSCQVAVDLPEYRKSMRPAEFWDYKKEMKKKCFMKLKANCDAYSQKGCFQKWDKIHASIGCESGVASLNYQIVKNTLETSMSEATKQIAHISNWVQKPLEVKSNIDKLLSEIKQVGKNVAAFDDTCEMVKRIKSGKAEERTKSLRLHRRQLSKISTLLCDSSVTAHTAGFFARLLHMQAIKDCLGGRSTHTHTHIYIYTHITTQIYMYLY